MNFFALPSIQRRYWNISRLAPGCLADVAGGGVDYVPGAVGGTPDGVVYFAVSVVVVGDGDVAGCAPGGVEGDGLGGAFADVPFGLGGGLVDGEICFAVSVVIAADRLAGLADDRRHPMVVAAADGVELLLRRPPDGDVRPAVAVVVGRSGLVGALSPRAEIISTAGPLHVPRVVARAENGGICASVSVIVGLRGLIAISPERKDGKVARAAVNDVPLAFGRAKDGEIRLSVTVVVARDGFVVLNAPGLHRLLRAWAAKNPPLTCGRSPDRQIGRRSGGCVCVFDSKEPGTGVDIFFAQLRRGIRRRCRERVPTARSVLWNLFPEPSLAFPA